MMTFDFNPDRIRNAISIVATRIAMTEDEIAWQNLSEQHLWAELVGCILSSQVRHETCSAAHERLLATGLLQITSAKTTPTMEFEAHLRQALIHPFTGTDNSFGFEGKYRFPNAKAKQIASTASHLYGTGPTLSDLLRNSSSVIEARRRLVLTCCGVGPKQASLFLRNVGFSSDVAILDAHVIQYMKMVGLAPLSNQLLSSIGRYEKGEYNFQCHAASTGFSMAILDTAIWVVMRTLSTEKQECPS